MSDFEVTVTDEGVGVVRPLDRLTMVSAKRFSGHVADLIGGGTSRIVVDLSRTGFVDSSGLGALIAGLKSARQAGGDLRLAAPSEQVTTILSLTNLDKVLRPRDSVESAF
ncbi:STAS domain-containing protein [Nocardioides sp. CFH 31398]|uniref:STAS domain-containing protein n=1 Tax=Nocardioides sp. CFH 31398 TaxID=2919579 RepID=UPI001F065225|nr:STAS domain-containing protein [Nocardioides sp. CFH 31398]MCH1867380.1 STAS domain-containing protein [Nocardioides sp. CFH 31398]MCH1868623.1 STAS domain-containing protein [Nocardioides sp. CFH 31398]